MNYKTELRKCGDPLYKTNQYWEFVKTNNEHQIKGLAEVLSLTTQYVRKFGGAWLVNVNKKPNYTSLSLKKKINCTIKLIK